MIYSSQNARREMMLKKLMDVLKNTHFTAGEEDITRKPLMWIPLVIFAIILTPLIVAVFIPIHCVLWLCGFHGLYYKSKETTFYGPNDMMMEKRQK